MEQSGTEYITYLWLAAGAVLLALEAFGAPGIGLVFAGLAGILVGIMLGFGLIDGTAYDWQLIYWFGFTAATAAVLWKPLQRWRTSSTSDEVFNNMVGDMATIVEKDLVAGQTGRAKWSGTVMNAELDPDAAETMLKVDETAEIIQVKGNVLILRPRITPKKGTVS
jgi:membrane protein implicated in regulation of membrane protease activity